MVQLMAFVLLLASSTQADGSPLKCSAQLPNSRTLYAVDGKLLRPDRERPLRQMNPDDVHAVQIFCMNPRDSTFNRSTGVPVVSIWTRSGPASLLEPTLKAVVTAQDAYHHKYLRYANDTGQLGLTSFPSSLDVTLQASDTGWVATITMNLYGATCYVFDGEVPSIPGSLTAREPRCISASGQVMDFPRP